MTILELFVWAAQHKVENFPVLYFQNEEEKYIELEEDNLIVLRDKGKILLY